MEAALAHPELVDTFLKRYSPGVLLRLHVKLEETEPRSRSRQTTSAGRRRQGPTQPLKTGTMCQAAVVVQKRQIDQLVLPWTKTLVGAD